MNYIDILLVIIVFFSFAIGWRMRGVYLIFIPIAFFTGIIFANVGYPVTAFFLKGLIANETKRMLIAYTTTFLVFGAAVVLTGIFTAKFFDFFKLTFVDRLLGAVIFISIIIIPVFFLFSFLDKTIGFNAFSFHDSLQRSLFFPAIRDYTFFIVKLPALKHLTIIETILK